MCEDSWPTDRHDSGTCPVIGWGRLDSTATLEETNNNDDYVNDADDDDHDNEDDER